MQAPLADILRPNKLEEIVGQKHILEPNKLLYKLVQTNNIRNMVLYGPPGTGKTTLAQIISKKTDRKLHKINATTASLKDIKEVILDLNKFESPNGILLYLDEIQYFNKKQQQTLLEFLEKGDITLIASTTENPYFYIYGGLLSRCVVFEFKSVGKEEIKKAILRGVEVLSQKDDMKILIKEDVLDYIAQLAGGDVRRAINYLESCYLAASVKGKKKKTKTIDAQTIEGLSVFGSSIHDRCGDNHYDLLSAYQKSMRGSDVDAAIYYLARLLEAGELLMACRRLMVCACEDVGLAYPNIIPIVNSACDIALKVGMPEARIPLADAVTLVCLSPKSNSAYLAIDQAHADIKNGKSHKPPRSLMNVHCDSADSAKPKSYKYPHNHPNHWVKQNYLPDELKNKTYYTPASNKTEQSFKEYWAKIKK